MKEGWVGTEVGTAAGRTIDAHVHTWGPRNELFRLARRVGIGKVVMLGDVKGILEANRRSLAVVPVVNTRTLRLMSRYPDFTIGFTYINAADPLSFVMEEIERCIVEGGMKGIKMFRSAKPSDKRLDPIIERTVELGVPVLHHTWHKAVWMEELESFPADVAELGRRFPDAKIMLASLGGGRERGVLDIVDLPNLYYDTSGSQPEAGLVEYAVQQLGPERVVFGSDWPVRDFGTQIGRILGANLTSEQQELLLYRNMERLLGFAG
jgi:predicted TIM-barrel fold metal-dependent hydrolase